MCTFPVYSFCTTWLVCFHWFLQKINKKYTHIYRIIHMTQAFRTKGLTTAARRFIIRSSSEKFALPNGKWTIPVLSALNSTFPFLNSSMVCKIRYGQRMQYTHLHHVSYMCWLYRTWGIVVVTVPAFGLGISPRGPKSLPRLATWSTNYLLFIFHRKLFRWRMTNQHNDFYFSFSKRQKGK